METKGPESHLLEGTTEQKGTARLPLTRANCWLLWVEGPGVVLGSVVPGLKGSWPTFLP